VLEANRLEIEVASCCASVDALDRLVPPGHGSVALRTAPDELLVIARREVGADVLRELTDRVPVLDPDALVMDVTDAWSGWSISGPDAADAFSRMSWLKLPADGAWAQGDVARVAAKVWVDGDTISIVVPAYWEDHLHQTLERVEVAS
jgi:hypothetical protein